MSITGTVGSSGNTTVTTVYVPAQVLGINDLPDYDNTTKNDLGPIIWDNTASKYKTSGQMSISSSEIDLTATTIDINGNAITTTNTNGDLDLTPHGTGVVNFKGNTTGGNNPGAIKILCEAGTHGITIKSPLHSASANYIYADDLNNDGYIDIITSQANTYSRVKWYRNLNGQGTFDSPQTIAYNLDMPHNIYAADINNNGYKDIILSHNSKLVWFENLNGQGNFSSEKTLLYNANSNNLAFGDLLGNGKTDLITLYGIDYDLMIYENLGYLGNQIYGNIKFDKNNNGCNLNDTPARQILVTADNGSHTFSTFTQPNGDYYLETNDGNFSVAPSYNSLPTYFNINPTTNNINFNSLGNSATLDFCLDSSQNINDLKVTIYPITSARPGFESEYRILYTNLGTTTLSGTINFSYDNTKLNYYNKILRIFSLLIISNVNSLISLSPKYWKSNCNSLLSKLNLESTSL